MPKLRIVIEKCSTYGSGSGYQLGDGYVERFWRGFMPNSTLSFLRSLTPPSVLGRDTEVIIVDEHISPGKEMELLKDRTGNTIFAIAGVQSHQLPRALDLAAFALDHGIKHVAIGGPHIMTCDTTQFHGRGVSFALSEAEGIWQQILEDAVRGELAPIYGEGRRWNGDLSKSPVLIPPPAEILNRYVIPTLGIYPARGCPYTCNFCSVIKIAGRKVRSEPVETTMASLRAAKAAGVKMIMFTSDNFNKYKNAGELLGRMIEDKIDLPFFVQCDTQVVKQPDMVELLGRANCFMMFVGVESFNRKVLVAAHKTQNHPSSYAEIAKMNREAGISTHFSNIIGFPEQKEADILEHYEVLHELDPDVASFYILTPIPGTEQYDEFLAKGWITAQSLDYLNAVHPTWRHPHLSHDDLVRLLFQLYRKFNTLERVIKNTRFVLSRRKSLAHLIGIAGYTAFSRMSSIVRQHPLSGGVGRMKFDKGIDYRERRRKMFDIDKVPFPKSLPLGAVDQALNDQAIIAV